MPVSQDGMQNVTAEMRGHINEQQSQTPQDADKCRHATATESDSVEQTQCWQEATNTTHFNAQCNHVEYAHITET